MELKLSENIRSFRKARSLTQEQLAEALGVTAGAVYKWEAKLSAPDLNLIAELADLFDTSVDVLLGYEIKNSKQEALVTRLKELSRSRDAQALAEAEKALARYPNCFNVVYQSATVYHVFGLIHRDNKLYRRAAYLMERALLLIAQNTDPAISELSIQVDIANIYFCAGDAKKAVELLKNNNPCGINDALIGQTLASACDLLEEAVPYLSMALLNNISAFTRIVMGYVNVYTKKRDYAAAADILRAALVIYAQFGKPNKRSFLDRTSAVLHTCLAHAQLELGQPEAARETLRTAKQTAEAFDRAPDYQGSSIRYVTTEAATAFDDLGETAAAAVENLIQDIGSESLTVLWAELCGET